MTVKMSDRVLPDTMVSPETGEMLRRGVRPFIVSYKGRSITVDMPGYYSDAGVGGVHAGDDMAVTDAALLVIRPFNCAMLSSFLEMPALGSWSFPRSPSAS